jgi:hypothetical protein
MQFSRLPRYFLNSSMPVFGDTYPLTILTPPISTQTYLLPPEFSTFRLLFTTLMAASRLVSTYHSPLPINFLLGSLTISTSTLDFEFITKSWAALLLFRFIWETRNFAITLVFLPCSCCAFLTSRRAVPLRLTRRLPRASSDCPEPTLGGHPKCPPRLLHVLPSLSPCNSPVFFVFVFHVRGCERPLVMLARGLEVVVVPERKRALWPAFLDPAASFSPPPPYNFCTFGVSSGQSLAKWFAPSHL